MRRLWGSNPPNISGDEKPKSPEFGKAMGKDSKNLKGDNMREASAEHKFRNPEPIREEVVQMAVKFLSHPSVRSSLVTSKRSFLENKGLTKEEIDEAFLRVPDPPSNVTIGQSVAPSQDMQTKSSTNILPQATVPAISSPSRFYWSHAFFVVGLLAASGTSMAILLKNFIFPRLKSWIRKVVLEEDDGAAKKSKPSLLEEVTAAAKTANTAASSAAKATMEMLNSKNKERQYFEVLIKRLDIQVAEMRSMSSTIWKLEGTREAASSSYKQPQKYVQYASRTGPDNTQQKSSVFYNKDPTSSLATPMKAVNGASSFDGSVRPSSAAASMKPSIGQHPKSYMEILAMIQRGEIPPGIKFQEINDSPPNPDQPLPNPSVAPRIKPWEVAQSCSNGTYGQNLGSIPQMNSNGVLPWWHQKNVRRTELEPGNGTSMDMHDVVTDRWPVKSRIPYQPSSFAMSKTVNAIRFS